MSQDMIDSHEKHDKHRTYTTDEEHLKYIMRHVAYIHDVT